MTNNLESMIEKFYEYFRNGLIKTTSEQVGLNYDLSYKSQRAPDFRELKGDYADFSGKITEDYMLYLADNVTVLNSYKTTYKDKPNELLAALKNREFFLVKYFSDALSATDMMIELVKKERGFTSGKNISIYKKGIVESLDQIKDILFKNNSNENYNGQFENKKKSTVLSDTPVFNHFKIKKSLIYEIRNEFITFNESFKLKLKEIHKAKHLFFKPDFWKYLEVPTIFKYYDHTSNRIVEFNGSRHGNQFYEMVWNTPTRIIAEEYLNNYMENKDYEFLADSLTVTIQKKLPDGKVLLSKKEYIPFITDAIKTQIYVDQGLLDITSSNPIEEAKQVILMVNNLNSDYLRSKSK